MLPGTVARPVADPTSKIMFETEHLLTCSNEDPRGCAVALGRNRVGSESVPVSAGVSRLPLPVPLQIRTSAAPRSTPALKTHDSIPDSSLKHITSIEMVAAPVFQMGSTSVRTAKCTQKEKAQCIQAHVQCHVAVRSTLSESRRVTCVRNHDRLTRSNHERSGTARNLA